MFKFKITLLFLISSFLLNPAIVRSQESPIIMIVLDCSRSMQEDIYGKNKFQSSEIIIKELLDRLKEYDFGLITFGKNEPYKLDDIEFTVIPFPENNSKILAELSKIRPKGSSPIGESLVFAGKILRKGLKNYLLLISDGIENCGGNPLLAAKNLVQSKKVVKIHTIGFDTTLSKTLLLKNIAEAGNGSYFHSDDYEQLFQSFTAPELSFENEEIINPIPEKELGNISYKCFIEKNGGFPAYGSEISIMDEGGNIINTQFHWKGIIEDVTPDIYTITVKHADSLQKKEITVFPNQTAYQSFVFKSETGNISYKNYILGSRDNMAYGTIIKIIHINGETVYTGNKWEGTIENLPVGRYKVQSQNSGISLIKDVTTEKGKTADIIFEFPLKTGLISYQCFLDSAMQKPAYGINLKIFKMPIDEIVHQDSTRWRGITKQLPAGDYIISGMLLGKVINEKVRVSANSTTFYDLIFNIKQVSLVYECYRNLENDPANGAVVSVIDAGGNEIDMAVGWRGSFTLPVGNYDLNISYQDIKKRQRVNLLPSMSDIVPIKIYITE